MNGEARRWVVRGMAFVLGGGVIVLGSVMAGTASSVIILVFMAILLGSALDPIVDTIRDHGDEVGQLLDPLTRPEADPAMAPR